MCEELIFFFFIKSKILSKPSKNSINPPPPQKNLKLSVLEQNVRIMHGQVFFQGISGDDSEDTHRQDVGSSHGGLATVPPQVD